ncbi:hypothetical protein KC363_g91 [Hortaea werneckii]|nr:hypothetical protein KC363_g91 [Hortaea werneckii]
MEASSVATRASAAGAAGGAADSAGSCPLCLIASRSRQLGLPDWPCRASLGGPPAEGAGAASSAGPRRMPSKDLAGAADGAPPPILRSFIFLSASASRSICFLAASARSCLLLSASALASASFCFFSSAARSASSASRAALSSSSRRKRSSSCARRRSAAFCSRTSRRRCSIFCSSSRSAARRRFSKSAWRWFVMVFLKDSYVGTRRLRRCLISTSSLCFCSAVCKVSFLKASYDF